MKNLLPKIAWEVKQKPLKISGLKDVDFKVLYRNDTKKLLSLRSSKYQTFTNADLMKLVKRIAKLGNFTVEGYADFLDGKRVIAFLKNNNVNLNITGLPVKEYLLIGNSHDASSKLFIGTANTLIRCNNQFSKKLRILEFIHKQAFVFSDEQLQDFLNIYEQGRHQLYSEFEKLKTISIDKKAIDELLDRLIKEVEEETKTNSSESRQLLAKAIQKETNDLGMNAWGLFNGVTWYTSHDLKNAQLTIGNVNGRAADLNKKAFDFCTQLN